MRIGIDLDGTITDFHKSLIRNGKKFLKENNIDFKIKNQNAFEIEDIFDLSESDLLLFKDHVRKTLRMNVKPRKNSREYLDKMHKENNLIYIITSRKESDQIDAYANTKKWLEDNNIYYDYLIVGNSNKLEECINNKIDLFIDDKAKHVSKMIDAGIESFLFDNVYNRKIDLPRVNNFEELINKS